MTTNSLTLIGLIAAATATITTSTIATAQEYFVYSAGWLNNSPQESNTIQLGEAYKCENNWCTRTLTYNGKDNTSRTILPTRHEMKLATNATKCEDGNITSIEPDIKVSRDGSLVRSKNGITLNIGNLTFTWTEDVTPNKPFRLTEIKDNITKETQRQVTGFGALADTRPSQQLSASQFIAKYQGEISHKDMNTAATDDWKTRQSNLNLNNFKASNFQSGLYSLITPGNPEVSSKAKKPIFVWHSFLSPSLSAIDGLFIHEYGHDFNGNGCFDDLGHNKFLMPAVTKNVVKHFFYVEYSPDIRDKVPMLSVGQYTRE